MGEYEIYKEKRHVLEMSKIDESGMQKFGTLDSSEKTIAILGGIDGGHRRRNRKGTKIKQKVCMKYLPVF